MSIVRTMLQDIEQKNMHEKEFLQAVREVLLSLEDFLLAHPSYLQAKIIERIVEPERVVMFKVPWIDDEGTIQINR